MNQNKTQIDYRLWPNILTLNEAIFILTRKIDECDNDSQRMLLRQHLNHLVDRRFDQIQFNKAMARIEKVA